MLMKIGHFRQNKTQLEHSAACDRRSTDPAKQYVYCKTGTEELTQHIHAVLKLGTILTLTTVKSWFSTKRIYGKAQKYVLLAHGVLFSSGILLRIKEHLYKRFHKIFRMFFRVSIC